MKALFRIVSLMIVVLLSFSVNVKAEIDPTDTTKTLFEQLEEEVLNAADDDVITIPAGEYIFQRPIKIEGKQIAFINDGPVTFKREGNLDFNMIEIANGAELAIISFQNDLVFEGESKKVKNSFIYSNGSLEISGGKFQNSACFDNWQIIYRAPIIVEGEGAKVTFNRGFVQNNMYKQSAAYGSGGFLIGDGATMIMNGGTIQNNYGSAYDVPSAPNGIWADSPGGGAIVVKSGATFEMNDGSIIRNKGWGGGVFVGNGSPYDYDRKTTDITKLKPQKLAKATFNGGEIAGNKGVGGGGISGYGNVEMVFPKDSTVVVRENRGFQGGGVFVSDGAVDGMKAPYDVDSNPRTTTPIPIDEWSKIYAGKLTIEGGTFTRNRASRCGGGIDVSSNGGYITGGTIKDNVAGHHGGGIYLTTVPYTLRMENVYIANNTARTRGGGIWLCPTGSGEFVAENGAIMHDNLANSAGDDFLNSNGVNSQNEEILRPEEYAITLPPRTPNGGKVTYNNDKFGKRVRRGAEKIEYTNIQKFVNQAALKTEITTENIEESRRLSNVIIEGNRAFLGGGIGSNGNIVIGNVTAKPKDLEVIKVWGDGTDKRDVQIEVRIQYPKDGQEINYVIDTLTLNEGNQYRAVVKDLPSTINAQPVEDLIRVKELDSDDFNVEVGTITKVEKEGTDDENDLFRVEVENKKRIPWTPLEPAKTKLSVQKVWENTEDADQFEVDVYLVKNGEVTDTKITLNKENGYASEFSDLLVMDTLDSPVNVYSVKEAGEVDGIVLMKENTFDVRYEKDGNTVTITNKKRMPWTPLEPAKTKLSVLKVWENTEDAEQFEVDVFLVKNGEVTDSKITLNKENNYSGEFSDLLVMDTIDSPVNVYSVKEAGEVDGVVTMIKDVFDVRYEKDGNTVTITNKKRIPWTPLEPAKTKLSVLKVWENTEDADQFEVEVFLVKNGKVTEQKVTLNKENGYAGEFSDLLVMDTMDSPVNVYSVKEADEADTVVTKNGNVFDVNYKTDGNVVTITNKKRIPWTPLEPAKTKLSVLKVWENTEDAEQFEVEVFLVKNGEVTDQKITLNKKNGYAGEFSDLLVMDTIDSPVNVYSVKEAGEVDGVVTVNEDVFDVRYETSGNAVTITNKKRIPWTPLEPAKTKLSVRKEWAQTDDADRFAIDVYLVKNGEVTDTKITLNKENGYAGEFSDLLVMDTMESAVNVYSVKEAGEVDGIVSENGNVFEVRYKTDGNAVTITNKKRIPVEPKHPRKETPKETNVPRTADMSGLTGFKVMGIVAIGVCVMALKRLK